MTTDHYWFTDDSEINQLLNTDEFFQRFYWLNYKTSHLHHQTAKAVDRVYDSAINCIHNRDYHGLWKVVSASYNRMQSDDGREQISEIWNAASTCLAVLKVDTNFPYNLAD